MSYDRQYRLVAYVMILTNPRVRMSVRRPLLSRTLQLKYTEYAVIY